ncbi:sensor histidine kinase [Nannocystis punicea]|uniref:histidine kinase n=1 Tax=Nannocystis punicea TaxID=2995304 RepID=A0ABY7HCI4_9BACT|nr:GAF domain-containing sensor histidine kinase [Nannocystis poenicansa]WAS96974.1 GAF domain-containing sensor histidine kinase [Nannocystis poenicansa]
MSHTPTDSVVATLLRLGVMGKSDWSGALQQVLEICCDLIAVERASYWSFHDDPAAIACELGYVHSKRLLERGLVVTEGSAPEYFEQIRSVNVLAIRDVREDPRLGALTAYFDTHAICGMLDVPVFAQGRLAGILCHEAVGEPREWTPHDIELALTLSHTLARLLEARARDHAEQSERKAAFLAQAASALADTLDPARAGEIVVRRGIPVLGDICTLIGYDGRRAWRIAAAHVEPAGQRILDQLTGRYGADIDGPGLGMQALRERQSLLMPVADEATLREADLPDGHIELLTTLRVRSVLSVLLRVRDEVTGVLTFATRNRHYDREDLRFAEAYAQQVGTLLENARLYAQAQAAIGARDDFLNLAGHELRTPLTSLQLAVELLRKAQPPGPPALQRAVDTIDRQATRLSRLTELIVMTAKHCDGGLPLRFARLDLAALVRDVAVDFADLFARAGCELQLHADDPVEIDGDETGLEVVVSNLLANAMKFGKGAPVEVRVLRRDGAARLVVVDHGIGIPVERLQSVFDRYQRAVSLNHFGGLGLGLHITAKIVDAHHGTIRADSRPGEGATFTVELPAAPVAAPPPG